MIATDEEARMVSRRRFLQGGVVALALGAAPARAQGKVVEIEFLHIHGGVQQQTVQKQIATFNRMQPRARVKELFVQGSYEGAVEKLQAMNAAGQAPAVAQGGFVYHKFYTGSFPITPVARFIAEERFDTSDFAPAMLALGKDERGVQWGLPYAVSTPIFYYNEHAYREVGLDPNRPPATWPDVVETARALATPDRAGVWYHYDITGNWLFQAMTECAGGRMIANDGKAVAFHEAAGVEALTFWVDLINRYKVKPVLGWTQAQQSWNAGKIAQLSTTTALLTVLSSGASFPVRATLFPRHPQHPRRVPAGGNNVYVFARDPDQQRAAWEFIKYITGPEGTTLTAQGMGYLSVRKSPLARPELMGDFLRMNPNASVTYRQLDEMVPWYNFPGRGGTRIYKLVQDAIQEAFLQRKAPKLALEEAAAAANRLIGRG
jgi:multiple sugar transport system substrate-binding protein